MSDPAAASGERPRPQYGEYATPEEQRARIAQPDASWALETGQAPASVDAAPAEDPVTVPQAGGPAARVPAGISRGRLIDRIATIALLVYGLLNVTLSVPRMFALAEGADGYLGLLGMEEPLVDFRAASLWGAIAGIVFILGWTATAWVSWRMLRRGRITFWVPLVGAVVFSVLAATCILIPAIADPAFLEFAQQLTRTGP